MTHKLLNSDRGFNIRKIELKEKHYEQIIEKTENRTDFIKKNPKKPKDDYNNTVLENTDLQSLINGFLDTKKRQRKKYIRMNKHNFKNLLPSEQKILFQHYYDYI